MPDRELENEKRNAPKGALSEKSRPNADASKKKPTKRVANRPTRWRLAIRDDPKLTHTAKSVAYVLSTYMDKEGVCWPSHIGIARGCGWRLTPGATSHRNVNRGVRELKEHGYLRVESRAETKQTNVYRAMFPIGGLTVSQTSSSGGHEGRLTVSQTSQHKSHKSKAFGEDGEHSLEDSESPLAVTPGRNFAPYADEDIPF